MKIIRSTNRDIINLLVSTFQFRTVTVKQFMFDKKGCFRKKTIHNPNTVKFIISRNQAVSGVLDGTQMTGSNVTRRSN